MNWRTIYITNRCKISLKNSNLQISKKNEEETSIPMKDVGAIVLESLQCTITSALLSSFSEQNIILFTCDKKHTPNGIFIPYHQHCRFSLITKMQIDWSEPFKKRAWKKLISQKIKNQAKVLKLIGKEKESKELITLIKSIKSGIINFCCFKKNQFLFK